jgi:hypothetical protein
MQLKVGMCITQEAKYSNVVDGIGKLGGVEEVRKLFLNFQANLYLPHSNYANG